MAESAIWIACDRIPYRKGFIEITAGVHPHCVNVETYEIAAGWERPLRQLLDVPDQAIVGNTEIELTVSLARDLAAALLRAADAAEAGASAAG